MVFSFIRWTLRGELKEEIYMDQPDGFVTKGQEGMVCRLMMASSKCPSNGMRSLIKL
jgi:hypothetical protein